MAKGKPSKRDIPASYFEQARDELFSHILRCGVLQAAVEDQKEWFDDTMDYLAERYEGMSDADLDELRRLGERYCQPVIRSETVGAPS
ncbi:MAG TPA: hypothetical protein VGA37_11885 [Gemmatimonadales bacterium]